MRLFHVALRFIRRDLLAGNSLFVFAALVAVGLAMLLAVRATVDSLQIRLDETAREILGGDISISGREPIPPFDIEVPGMRYAGEIRTRTMVQSKNASVLVQLRAVDANFPLYGKKLPFLEEADQRSGALVEPGLLDRLEIVPGDSVSLLGSQVKVLRDIESAPGDLSLGAIVAPRLYLPRERMPESILSAKGSIVDYSMLLAVPRGESTDRVADRIRSRIDISKFDVVTSNERAARIGKSVENVGALGSSVALASTLLALLGSGIAVRAYLRDKQNTAALLDCLGARRSIVASIYLCQIVVLGASSGLLASVGAAGLHVLLLKGAAAFTSTTLPWALGPWLFVQGLIYGTLLTLWVAWPGLAMLMETSGLAVLRATIEPPPRDLARIVLHRLSGLLLMGILWLAAGATKAAGVLLAGTLGALLVLVIAVLVVRKVTAKVTERIRSAISRLALRNLGRPGNQTTPILMSITLACALSIALSIVERTIEQTRVVGTEDGSANIFLYQLDPEQAPVARKLITDHHGTIVQELPVVLMRIRGINGRDVKTILEQSPEVERWPLTREYWTSYRSSQQSNERVVEGPWIEKSSLGQNRVPVSLDQRLATRLGVKVGDEVEWEVHGLPITTYVANLREILWEKFERNSFVVFPIGVLEDAPQFYFWSMHVPDSKTRAKLIQEVTAQLPNVSLVDLSFTVQQVVNLLTSVGIALKVLFSLVAIVAFALLLTVTFSSRVERRSEIELLTRVGMRSRQIRSMIQREYLTLGLLALVLGTALGFLIGWSICYFSLRLAIEYSLTFILATWIFVIAACSFAGRLVTGKSVG